jgi:3-methyl-2-oxobutanoate hydroxymethyltransferase
MSSSGASRESPVTTRHLLEMKQRGEKIVALTAYDYFFGRLVDEAGVDIVLVGDSLGQVVLGLDSTIPVTLDAMIHHGRAVRRAVKHGLVVLDMPFMTYGITESETLHNAARMMQEAGVEAVKLEGGSELICRHVGRMVEAGIPVMGHIGLTPQSVHALGGYRVQGREADRAEQLRTEARRLADAGCFAIVLELLPAPLSREITRDVGIPTIGIGAGPHVDGQVLVLYDMLGLNDTFKPKFLRRFADLAGAARAGIGEYVEAVRRGEYPDAEHSHE